MHEMAIAAALMDQLLQIAAAQQATRIQEVELRCGVMQQVVGESLQLAFEVVSADTLARGATLKIVEQPLVVRCRPCGRQFDAAIDNFLCPQCRTADVDIVAGRDIVLQSVVCEPTGGAVP
jgi:hydrogenase nickel incorporation protein HypA/HybF